MPRTTNTEEYAEIIVYPRVSGTKFGQVTVVTAGTPVQGGSVLLDNGVYLKGHPDNTDVVWVFGADQTKANGWPLSPGEQTCSSVANLNELYFDADVSGEKICWNKG